jgi:hypothetical protein
VSASLPVPRRNRGDALTFGMSADIAPESIVASLAPVGLASLGAAALMDRVDEKFVLPRAELSEFLSRCAAAYQVLEIHGRRQGHYRTTYFDTTDLSFYHAHLTGRLPRRKVRTRTYVESGDSFLEVKRRDNHGRTVKARVPIVGDRMSALSHLMSLPAVLVESLSVDSLSPVVTTDFTRTTLVDLDGVERVTIDSGLTFSGHGDTTMFPALVCIEIKQARSGPSAALTALREMRQRPSTFSKYCFGVTCTVPGVPSNRFKPMIDRLHRIARDDHEENGR